MTTTFHKLASLRPRLEFKSSSLRTKLKPLCDKVLKEFQQLPVLRLLCYFDDENPELLQRQFGQFTGIHTPIIGAGTWPPYISEYFLEPDGDFAFDNLIYVPKTIHIEEKIPFVITFSH